MPDIRRATPADRAAAAASLASAFSTDPLFHWAAGGRTPTESCLTALFRTELGMELGGADHEVYVASDCGAVAVWKGIDQWRSPWTREIRMLPALVRCFRRPGRALRLFSMIERAHPSQPHYYLETLGTHRSRRGQGLGSAVLAPMLARCDEEGVPAYLENSSPANDAFYGRHGFERRGEMEVPEGAPRVLAMWREPRG